MAADPDTDLDRHADTDGHTDDHAHTHANGQAFPDTDADPDAFAPDADDDPGNAALQQGRHASESGSGPGPRRDPPAGEASIKRPDAGDVRKTLSGIFILKEENRINLLISILTGDLKVIALLRIRVLYAIIPALKSSNR